LIKNQTLILSETHRDIILTFGKIEYYHFLLQVEKKLIMKKIKK